MSKNLNPESRRLVPRFIAGVLLATLVIAIGAYAAFRTHKYYKWVHIPKVTAQRIVLEEFDSWMRIIPVEFSSEYEALREIASQDKYSAPVYYVIGIRMLDQIAGGKIESDEVRTIVSLGTAIEEYESIVTYFFNMYQEPGIQEAGTAFWDLGAPPLKFDEF